MPVIYRWKNFKFYFYSDEGSRLEAPHIHVRRNDEQAKFWLSPEVKLANTYGFSDFELNKIKKLIEKHKTLFIKSWNDYFRI